MNVVVFFYKVSKIAFARLFCWITSLLTRILFCFNGIKFMGGIRSSGIPIIHMSLKARCFIGHNFTMGNWSGNNASGVIARCKIEVRNNAILEVGSNVGITSTTIICHNKIVIGDYVKVGVGTHIYDTNFHNIDPMLRKYEDPLSRVKSLPIHICDNAFIGAFSIILKGVTIGENSVVAAGSVVCTDIPSNEIWGGNPARFIKKL